MVHPSGAIIGGYHVALTLSGNAKNHFRPLPQRDSHLFARIIVGLATGIGLMDGSTMSIKIGIRAWIDFAFRKIFGKPGNEICLISLLNAVLQLPHPVVSVVYLNPFGMKDFESDKLVCVDVKATDQGGRVFLIEVQIVVQSSFAKRAVFYAW